MDQHRKIIKGLIKKQEENIERFNEWIKQEPNCDNICLKVDYFDGGILEKSNATCKEIKGEFEETIDDIFEY